MSFTHAVVLGGGKTESVSPPQNDLRADLSETKNFGKVFWVEMERVVLQALLIC